MQPPRLASLFAMVGLGLTLTTACKREPDAASAEAKPRDRKTRCEGIGAETTRMGMMMAKGLAAGLSEGKAKIDEAEEASLRRELEQAEQELVRQCMEWPEEAVDCFGLSGALSGAKCERILAAAMGEPVLPDDVPAGPALAWRASLPHELSLLHGRDDGSAIAVVEVKDPADGAPRAHLVAVADGKQRWEKPLSFEPFLLEPLGDDAVLVVGDREIAAFGVGDGNERWTTPSPAVDPTDEDRGRVELVSFARADARIAFLATDLRLFELHPERCAKGPCLDTLATVELSETYGSRWLEPGPGSGPDRGWLVIDAEDGAAHVLDAAGKRRAMILAHTSVSWVQPVGPALRVGLDGAVVELDLAACGSAPFAPVTWPPAGKPKWVADATVRDVEATPTPTGCVRWSTPLGLAEGSERVDAGAGSGALVVQSGGFLLGLGSDGSIAFKSPINAVGPVVARKSGYAAIGDLGVDDVSLVLSWLDASGKHLQRSAVPLAEGKMLLFDDVEMVTAGSAMIAGSEQTLVAFVDE